MPLETLSTTEEIPYHGVPILSGLTQGSILLIFMVLPKHQECWRKRLWKGESEGAGESQGNWCGCL